MKKLSKLIYELCPNGVDYKELEEIAFIGTGNSNRVDAEEGGEYPFFVRSKQVMRSRKFSFDEEAIIIPGEGGIGEIFHYMNGKYDLHQRAYRISFKDNKVNTKFAYYYLISNFKKYILMKAVTATVISIRRPMIASFLLPLPPLPVQEEIVRILDTFTALETELEAELAARTKQYEHYREELLGLEVSNVLKSEQIDTTKRGRNNKSTDSVLMRIDELCHIQRGRVMSKDYLRDNAGIFPVYSSQTENQGVFGYINSFDFDFESLTWTTDGANAGSIFYHNQEKFSITNVCGLLRVKSPKINTKFLYYALQNTAKEYVNYGMGNPKLMCNVMGRVKIIVPPLAVQEKIVSILDRFDALVNDLKSGLPAEIALRRKQYEYYRNKLLTFKPKPTD
jgi:type I restriction enzyme S subunit